MPRKAIRAAEATAQLAGGRPKAAPQMTGPPIDVGRLDELIARLGGMARRQSHIVPQESGNLDSLIGGFSQRPLPSKTSYAESVAPFYARTGGLQREIDASQAAAKQYPVDFGVYGAPRYHLIEDAVPVRYESLPSNADAKYGNGLITVDRHLDPVYVTRAALPHEATHHIYLAGGEAGRVPDGSLARSPESQLFKDSRRQFFEGELPFNSPYLNRPVELDAHLADVRRRYAALEGRAVRTPDEAADAWAWWVRGGRAASDEAGLPATISQHTQYYDTLPPAAREVMFRRMPGMAPAVLAPLLAPMALESEE